jgi:hypothetical protein
MAKITFECGAPQSTADADVYVKGEDKPFRKMRFEDGEPFFLLVPGQYELDGRVIGTPGTDFSLEVKDGGKMVPVKIKLPTKTEVGSGEEAGRDGFERLLTVEEKADKEKK